MVTSFCSITQIFFWGSSDHLYFKSKFCKVLPNVNASTWNKWRAREKFLYLSNINNKNIHAQIPKHEKSYGTFSETTSDIIFHQEIILVNK